MGIRIPTLDESLGEFGGGKIYAYPGTLNSIFSRENPDGKEVIFAPNHLRPPAPGEKGHGSLLSKANVSLDLSVLKGLFASSRRGIFFKSIYQTEPPSKNETNEIRSQTHQTIQLMRSRVMKLLRGMVYDGYAVYGSEGDPMQYARQNVQLVREILDGSESRKENLLIFPFRKWFETGEQDFGDEVYDFENREYHTYKSLEEDQAEWNKALKPGLFYFARKTGKNVVPVYTYRNPEDGKYTYIIGKIIEVTVDDNRSETDLIREYLEQMRKMKEKAIEYSNR